MGRGGGLGSYLVWILVLVFFLIEGSCVILVFLIFLFKKWVGVIFIIGGLVEIFFRE